MNDKLAKNIRWRKAISSVNGVGKMGQLDAKKMKLDYNLTPHKNYLKTD